MNRHSNTRRSLVLGLVALPLAAAAPALAQDECRGWAMSCASVDVRSDGERLVLFAPNLVSADAAVAPEGEPREVPSGPSITLSPVADADVDPGTLSCDGDGAYMAKARGLDEDDRKRCRRAPVGAFFLVALPASLFVFGPDGETPVVDSPSLPGEPANSPEEADDGEEDDGGAGTGDSGGEIDGDAGGDDGDGAGVGNTQGGDAGGDSTGGGNPGGGPGDDGWGEDDPWHPGADDLPPISQVPEPVSTTLFGLGLASYAATRIRRRRAGAASEEDA